MSSGAFLITTMVIMICITYLYTEDLILHDESRTIVYIQYNTWHYGTHSRNKEFTPVDGGCNHHLSGVIFLFLLYIILAIAGVKSSVLASFGSENSSLKIIFLKFYDD